MAIFVPNSPLAGFNVGTGSLQGPSVILDDLTGASTSTFLINGGAVGDEFFISASNFNVKANGNITASNALLAGTITATAGFIGGWTIGSTTLQGGNVVLDSTGNIRTATNFTTGDGFFLNDQATNNFRVGLAGGSRLQFTGTNIEIYDSSTKVVSLGTVNEIAGFGLTPAAISSSNNQLVLRSNGQITGSNVLFNGGRIAGFTLSDSTLSNGSSFFISGSATANGFFISSSKFNVKANGDVTGSNVLFTGGKIAGFTISDSTLSNANSFFISGSASGDQFFLSSSAFNVKANGNVTGSNVLFTGGRIAGFTISNDTLSNSTNFYISGSATSNGFFISSSRFNVKANGDVTGSQVLFTGGRIGSFVLTNNALNGVRSDTGATSFFISSSVDLTSADGVAFFISSSRFNVRQDGTISGSNVLFNGGKVGGFTIDSSKITGTNIVIDSAGSIQTSNYASDLTGWRVTADGNGFAEFENAKIRGTLSTAVFEKQSVNAVGGQLYVANSTILTGSGEAGASTNGEYTATQTTMSVENVTGFEVGEIITAKKFSGTGFGTEYMRINSASRANPSSETDFSGRIYVTRALGSGVAGNSSSLGETPGAGQPYSGSQVIVSTGKLGTGFIRINANPNDQATPYIDIVERTGSGVYDVALKARLGDLSGLANSNYVFGDSAPGFGLATDNVFLQGGIIANTGSIGGISMQSSKLFTGTGTFNNNNTGFYLDSTSNFSLGNKLSWNGSTLSVSGTLNATDGNIGGFNITRNAITGSTFYLSGSAVGDGFFISSSGFNVKANGNVTGSQVLFNGGVVGGFTITSTAISSSNNLLTLRSNGQITGSNALFDGGRIGGFTITSTAISSSNDDLILKSNGQITGSSVLFDGGKVGGFTIGTTTLTAGGSALSLRSDGEITGSVLRLRRTISSTEYVFLDTVQGAAAFTNIGRQVVSDPTEWSKAGGDDGGTETLISNAEWYFNVLPGETKLIVTYQHLAHVNGSTNTKGTSRLRWDMWIPTGSATSSYDNSAIAYNNPFVRNATSTYYAEPTLVVSGSNSGSALVSPAAGQIVSLRITDNGASSYEGNLVKLTLSIANDLNTTTGTTAQTAMTTKVKNICAYTTTDVGAAFSSRALSNDLFTK
jgi:hypothetical protein